MRLDIELTRVISAFGIVWFHSGVDLGRDIAYAGLVYFVIISSYFATTSKKEHHMPERVLRLLVPCFIWSVIYASFKIIRGVPVFPENYSAINMLLATPSIHLWYLPFLFFGIIAIDTAKKYFSNNVIGVVAGVTTLLLVTTAPEWRSMNFISPWGQYLHALPALLIGVFFGGYGKISGVLRTVITFGIFFAISVMTLKGMSGFGITYLFGIIPCLVLFKKDSIIKKSKVIAPLSMATFGVYLIHVLVLFVFRHFGIVGIFLPILSFTVSILAVMLARKYLPKSIIKYAL